MSSVTVFQIFSWLAIFILFLNLITVNLIAPGAVSFAVGVCWVFAFFGALGLIIIAVNREAWLGFCSQPAGHHRLLSKWGLILLLILTDGVSGWLISILVMITVVTHALVPEVLRVQKEAYWTHISRR